VHLIGALHFRYGLEILRFAAERTWLSGERKAFLRGYNVTQHFEKDVRNFSKSTKKCAPHCNGTKRGGFAVVSILLVL
jgi:hypothetical protein